MVATSSPVGKEGREGERETKRNENKYEYKAAFKVFYEFFFSYKTGACTVDLSQ